MVLRVAYGMRLLALVPRAEVQLLLSELLPLKVLLGDEDDDRMLLLRDAGEVGFVAGQGVRMACKADVRWSLLGIAVPVHLRSLSVLLAPRIAERAGGAALVFQVWIEHADLAGVPALVDAHLVDRVNQALEERQVELAWNFTRTLTHSFDLPALLQSVRFFNLGVGASSVEVRPDALHLEVELRAGFTRA
jgi:hypothetical protein